MFAVEREQMLAVAMPLTYMFFIYVYCVVVESCAESSVYRCYILCVLAAVV